MSIRASLEKLVLEGKSNGTKYFYLSPDPHKVKAIQEAPPPTSAKAVRSFLGMASYCSKFIHNFSHLADPLRELTKKDVTFKWTGKHDNAFKQLKATKCLCLF